jgi:hypothetical protein
MTQTHRIVCTVAVLFCLFPCSAEAKRRAPQQVQPVEHNGVIYSAPNEDGFHAMVRATEASTGKVLWEQEIFSSPFRPPLEEDVQHRFIQELRLEGDHLLVFGEGGSVDELDLRTRRLVTQPDSPTGISSDKWLRLALVALLMVWLIQRRLQNTFRKVGGIMTPHTAP